MKARPPPPALQVRWPGPLSHTRLPPTPRAPRVREPCPRPPGRRRCSCTTPDPQVHPHLPRQEAMSMPRPPNPPRCVSPQKSSVTVMWPRGAGGVRGQRSCRSQPWWRPPRHVTSRHVTWYSARQTRFICSGGPSTLPRVRFTPARHRIREGPLVIHSLMGSMDRKGRGQHGGGGWWISWVTRGYQLLPSVM